MANSGNMTKLPSVYFDEEEATMASNVNKDTEYSRFKHVSDEEKQQILLDHNSKNTQQKTKQCVNLLNQYLLETGQKCLDELSSVDLPFVLENFYISLQRKKSAGV